MKTTYWLPMTVMTVALAACGGTGRDAAQAPQPVAQVEVVRVAPGTIAATLQSYGTVEYPPQAQSMFTATSEAVVEQILVANGQPVRRGQPLLRIRPSASALQDLATTRTDAATTAQAVARIERLYAKRLATNADLAQARQQNANAQAALSSARTRIGDGGARVLRAARDATVVGITVTQGDIVAADTSLLKLATSGHVMVRLGVEPADAAVVKPGQHVRLGPVYEPDRTLDGTIVEVMEQVDSQTRLLQATVSLPSAEGLLPGSTVRGHIEVDRRQAVLVIPRSAILYDGDAAHAFVVTAGMARKRALSLGIADDDRVQVVSGLKADELVVTAGNHELEDGMAVAVTAAAGSGQAKP